MSCCFRKSKKIVCDKYLDFSKTIGFRNNDVGKITLIHLMRETDEPYGKHVGKLGIITKNDLPAVKFVHQCGHSGDDHIDSDKDLINIVHCNICSKWMEDDGRIHDHKLKCKKKLEEEKEMKHPCGKVFDAKKFKITPNSMIENFIVGHDFIYVKLKNFDTVFKFEFCGHYKDHKPMSWELESFEGAIDWNKPIEVVNEVNGATYPAKVTDEYVSFVFVSVFLARRENHTLIFSNDGKECQINTSFMKLVARNV